MRPVFDHLFLFIFIRGQQQMEAASQRAITHGLKRQKTAISLRKNCGWLFMNNSTFQLVRAMSLKRHIMVDTANHVKYCRRLQVQWRHHRYIT